VLDPAEIRDLLMHAAQALGTSSAGVAFFALDPG
jgi:hypothetical protein